MFTFETGCRASIVAQLLMGPVIRHEHNESFFFDSTTLNVGHNLTNRPAHFVNVVAKQASSRATTEDFVGKLSRMHVRKREVEKEAKNRTLKLQFLRTKF